MSDQASLAVERCLARWQGGDVAARDELFALAQGRLERLARMMLRNYPGVRRWEQTGDVLQNAMVRLDRALRQVTLTSARDFYRLAAAHLRRELIDLARHHHGPEGAGAHHASAGPDRPMIPEPGDESLDPSRLALWSEFHRQVEALPEEQREVFDLLWYQGLTQDEAAVAVGVSTRTIKSRWRDARLRLNEILGGDLPGL